MLIKAKWVSQVGYLHFHRKVSNVKELQKMVSGGGTQPIAITVPFEVHDGTFVSVSGKSEIHHM